MALLKFLVCVSKASVGGSKLVQTAQSKAASPARLQIDVWRQTDA